MAMNYTPLPLEFLEEMEELSDAEYGRLIRWGQKYHLTGQESKLSGNERFYAKRVKMQIDRYKENYDAAIEQRRAAGRESARRRAERALTPVDGSQRNATGGNNTETDTETETETDETPPPAPAGAPEPAGANSDPLRDPALGEVMSFYMENISKAVPSAVTTQSIQEYTAEMGGDLVLHALRLAAEAEAHDWRYAKKILERYRGSGITTMEAVREDEMRARQRKSRRAEPAAPEEPRDDSVTMEQIRALRRRIVAGAGNS